MGEISGDCHGPNLLRPHENPGNNKSQDRERVVNVLVAATFLIFFQAFMVAPLIPRLADSFHASLQTIGWMVPAYMVPYAVSTPVYGVLADRLGRRRVILGSLVGFIVVAALTATTTSRTRFHERCI